MSNSKKKIRGDNIIWGIIGVGDVCEIKSAPAMNLIEHSSIGAVMRRSGEKAADYAKRHGVPRWYSDAQQLIDDKDVNAIYIATPPSSHSHLTRLAAPARKPIYVEKPMGLNYQDCLQMNAVCAKYNVPLFVAYYRRSLPNFLKVKELLNQGIIGDIRAVEIKLTQPLSTNIIANSPDNWRVDPAISGGGYFVDLASHQFDLLDFLIGKITNATGYNNNQAGLYAAEDIVSASYRFDNDVLGTGLWCFTSSQVAAEENMTIIGALGQISFQCFGDNAVVLTTDQGGQESFSFEMPKHIQHPHIQSIVDDLMGVGTSNSTGDSASRSNWVIDQILKNKGPN